MEGCRSCPGWQITSMQSKTSLCISPLKPRTTLCGINKRPQTTKTHALPNQQRPTTTSDQPLTHSTASDQPTSTPKLAPGPAPKPLLTNILDINFLQPGNNIEHLYREYNTDVLRLDLFGETCCFSRNPDHFEQALVSMPYATFNKTNFKPVAEWLGASLIVQDDGPRHSKLRALLQPAFRADYVRSLIPCFADVAADMHELLMHNNNTSINIEDVFRRATLDVIGVAGFQYKFNAVKQSPIHPAYKPTSSSSSSSSAKVSSTAATAVEEDDDAYNHDVNDDVNDTENPKHGTTWKRQVDVVDAFDKLLSTAMLLLVELPVPNWMLPGYSNYQQSVAALHDVVLQVLAQRRKDGVQDSDRDLLSYMLRAQEQQKQTQPNTQQYGEGADDDVLVLTDEDLVYELQGFLFAGADTTAGTLSFLMHGMAQRPDIQQRVLQEVHHTLSDTPPHTWTAELLSPSNMPLLNACIQETLRLWPAAVAQSRMTKEDTVLGEYLFPKGSLISLDIYALHRHEGIWPRPAEWLPERWLPEHHGSLGPRRSNAFLPFGVGARSCLGRVLAMMEMQVLAASVLREFAVEPDAERMPEAAVAMTIKGKDGVWVVARAR